MHLSTSCEHVLLLFRFVLSFVVVAFPFNLLCLKFCEVKGEEGRGRGVGGRGGESFLYVILLCCVCVCVCAFVLWLCLFLSFFSSEW